jgi:hypothetical protein
VIVALLLFAPAAVAAVDRAAGYVAAAFAVVALVWLVLRGERRARG